MLAVWLGHFHCPSSVTSSTNLTFKINGQRSYIWETFNWETLICLLRKRKKHTFTRQCIIQSTISRSTYSLIANIPHPEFALEPSSFFTPLFIPYRILGLHPNSYTFTKRLTETLVDEYSDKIPVVIARPSIGKGHKLKVKLVSSFNL